MSMRWVRTENEPDSNTPVRVGETSERVKELEDYTRSIAQIIHQAYHQDQPGTWRSCPKDICASARGVLGMDREVPV